MYRHFAAVTVLLTAILAMFAEGEDRRAQAAPVTRVAERPATPRIVAANQAAPPAPDWWEVDSSSDEGSGTVGGDGGMVAGFDDSDEPGGSSEYPASLSEDERELLLAGMQESGVLDPAARD
jgi:hypothetical protein